VPSTAHKFAVVRPNCGREVGSLEPVYCDYVGSRPGCTNTNGNDANRMGTNWRQEQLQFRE